MIWHMGVVFRWGSIGIGKGWVLAIDYRTWFCFSYLYVVEAWNEGNAKHYTHLVHTPAEEFRLLQVTRRLWSLYIFCLTKEKVLLWLSGSGTVVNCTRKCSAEIIYLSVSVYYENRQISIHRDRKWIRMVVCLAWSPTFIVYSWLYCEYESVHYVHIHVQ